MPKAPKLSPEGRLKAIIDGTQAGTWEWNLDTGDVIINDRWAAMLGYTIDDMAPMTYPLWESLCHPRDLVKLKQGISQYLRGKAPHFDCVVRLRHRDGHWRWIHTRGRRLEDENVPGQWLCGTHLDITEERETQHHLQRLSESLPGVIYTFILTPDGDFRFRYISRKSLEFYGIPAEVSLRDPSAFFDTIVADDMARVKASIMESARTLSEWRCRYRINVGGTVRWMEGVADPEQDEAGNIVWHGMVMDVTRHKELEEELERLSVTDELTGLFNRRHMLRTIEEKLAQAERYGQVFSLISLDVDHFKQINDRWGHLVGDKVLQQFAGILQARVRRTDVVARTGGEEFLILLPNTGREDACLVAETLREASQREAFRNDQEEPITVTLSAGVVSWSPTLTSVRSLLSECDRSLYAAKRQGRNRVIMSSRQ